MKKLIPKSFIIECNKYQFLHYNNMCLQHYDQIFYDFPYSTRGKSNKKWNRIQPFFLTKNIINTLWKVVEGVDSNIGCKNDDEFAVESWAVSRD